MFRLRSKSGDESVFRSPEEIRSALLSGFVTPDAQIWDAELKGWVPLLEHALYQQIAAAPPGRKSGAVKGPSSGATPAIPTPGPSGPKPIPKLVIKRPGEGATTATPVVKPPAPPVQPPKAPAPPPPPRKSADDLPDLELISLDLTPEPMEAPAPTPPPPPRPTPPAPTPPIVQKPVAAPPPPPRRPTPPPAPEPVLPRLSTPRLSTPRLSVPVAARVEEEAAAGGSKKGIIIGAVLLLAAAGAAYAVLGGKKEAPPAVDTVAVTTPAAPAIDTSRHDATAVDSTTLDATATPPATATTVAPADTPKPAPVSATARPRPDTNKAPAPAAVVVAPVPFAPIVARGATPWNARQIPGAPLTIPTLEVVRLRYLAAQSRALGQFESGLEAAGFADLFDPAKLASANRRNEAFDAVDVGRSALRDFRKRQAAIDFAYTDSMRQAMPAGSDTPDFRTFGPILRESPAQAALTDSLVGAVAEMYGMLTTEVGGYTFRGGNLTWKDADNAQRYQTLVEQLTAQIARIRNRAPSDIPPAMAATLRGIGLPR